MKEDHVEIRKAKNGQITIRCGNFVKKVDVRELYPDAKIEAVKEGVLAVGGVWNQQVEDLAMRELFI